MEDGIAMFRESTDGLGRPSLQRKKPELDGGVHPSLQRRREKKGVHLRKRPLQSQTPRIKRTDKNTRIDLKGSAAISERHNLRGD
jgi:hypothetical protein